MAASLTKVQTNESTEMMKTIKEDHPTTKLKVPPPSNSIPCTVITRFKMDDNSLASVAPPGSGNTVQYKQQQQQQQLRDEELGVDYSPKLQEGNDCTTSERTAAPQTKTTNLSPLHSKARIGNGNENDTSNTLDLNNQHYCDHCDIRFSSAAHYKLHEQTHNKEKAMQCDMCGMTFTQVADQLLHMIYCERTEVRLHPCTTCGESFKTQEALWDHVSTHTGITYPCNVCDKVFPVQELLSRHQAAECTYCKYCKKYFTSAHVFENHKKTWSHYIKMDAESQDKQKCVKENVLRCPICEKSFRQELRLTRHVASHKQNMHKLPLSCDQCGKRFPTPLLLKQHKKECGKRFNQTHHLQRHSLIHSAERPFKCDNCDWTFKTKGSLKRHVLTHNNFKTFAPGRYQCQFCNISYSREYRLMNHIIALHNETLLECYFCPLNFCYRSTWEEHERLHLDGVL